MIQLRPCFYRSSSQVTAQADERFITLSSTTSTQNCGLFGSILLIFKNATGISVHVVAVGTGQALAIGQRGDADALLLNWRFTFRRRRMPSPGFRAQERVITGTPVDDEDPSPFAAALSRAGHHNLIAWIERRRQ